MREIKFRAWDTETKEMSYDYLDRNWLKVCIESPYVELMQYTGLKDKNGKEIYEGDVLKITHEDGDSEFYEVRYMADNDYPAFDLVPHLDCDSNGLSHAMAVCEIEIIGNIYEDPNLLEVENANA